MNWRFALALGLTIGLSLAASREAESDLEPSLGRWGAALVSWVVAVVVAGLVWAVVHLLQTRGRSGPPEG
jgi:hypothetical protein